LSKSGGNVYESRSNTEASKHRYIATLLQFPTHTHVRCTIFIKTNAHIDTSSAELRSHSQKLRGVNYSVRVLVWVNERESVTKFHFPFWQRRAARLPVRRHLNGGARLVCSEIEIFHVANRVLSFRFLNQISNPISRNKTDKYFLVIVLIFKQLYA
jgi:hypothetical protein